MERFSVFHEVGRIDELPSFPHPEVGVDNDGVLVSLLFIISKRQRLRGEWFRSEARRLGRLAWSSAASWSH